VASYGPAFGAFTGSIPRISRIIESVRWGA